MDKVAKHPISLIVLLLFGILLGATNEEVQSKTPNELASEVDNKQPLQNDVKPLMVQNPPENVPEKTQNELAIEEANRQPLQSDAKPLSNKISGEKIPEKIQNELANQGSNEKPLQSDTKPLLNKISVEKIPEIIQNELANDGAEKPLQSDPKILTNTNLIAAGLAGSAVLGYIADKDIKTGQKGSDELDPKSTIVVKDDSEKINNLKGDNVEVPKTVTETVGAARSLPTLEPDVFIDDVSIAQLQTEKALNNKELKAIDDITSPLNLPTINPNVLSAVPNAVSSGKPLTVGSEVTTAVHAIPRAETTSSGSMIANMATELKDLVSPILPKVEASDKDQVAKASGKIAKNPTKNEENIIFSPPRVEASTKGTLPKPQEQLDRQKFESTQRNSAVRDVNNCLRYFILLLAMILI